MQQRIASGFVWSLSRGKIHSNKTSLVVEVKSRVRSVGRNATSYGTGAIPRRRSLRGRGFSLFAGADEETSTGIVHQMQYSLAGHVFENIQLLHVQ